jgi:hypothetical protein
VDCAVPPASEARRFQFGLGWNFNNNRDQTVQQILPSLGGLEAAMSAIHVLTELGAQFYLEARFLSSLASQKAERKLLTHDGTGRGPELMSRSHRGRGHG